MKKIINYLEDFLNLFFPKTCVVCGKNLFHNENILCTKCLYFLPRTNFHKINANPVSHLFWGIVDVKSATSYYFFGKGSKYQAAIHKLKYKGQKEIGQELGKYFGSELINSDFDKVDVLIPVPLHVERLKKRGYNQSEMIAEGMSEVMKKKLDIKSVIRKTHTETQTKKNLDERRENVKSVFQIKNPENLKGKHILLVDDVITTGSTLASLAEEILQIDGTKVSIATLAVAAQQ